MADYPLSFKAPMVLALLEGRKTQTRRIAQNDSPSIEAGDRFWVREAYRFDRQLDHLTAGKIRSRGEPVLYKADHHLREDGCLMIATGKVRSGRHMRNIFSRITLLVCKVRVQYLQDISEEDAKAEGVEPLAHHFKTAKPYISAFIDLWNSLYGKKKGCGWRDNPKVTAYSFVVIKNNILDVAELADKASQNTRLYMDYFHAAKDLVAQIYNRDDFFQLRSRCHEISQLRALTFYLANVVGDVPKHALQRIVGYDRHTISYHLQKIEDQRDNAQFDEFIESLSSAYTNLLKQKGMENDKLS